MTVRGASSVKTDVNSYKDIFSILNRLQQAGFISMKDFDLIDKAFKIAEIDYILNDLDK